MFFLQVYRTHSYVNIYNYKYIYQLSIPITRYWYLSSLFLFEKQRWIHSLMPGFSSVRGMFVYMVGNFVCSIFHLLGLKLLARLFCALLGCIFWWFGRLFWWRPAWPALTGQPPLTFDFQLNMFIKLLNCILTAWVVVVAIGSYIS